MAGSTDAEMVTGLILAGGRSRRMGSGDKGLLELGAKPMLAHVIDRMRPQVRSLVLNANGDPARFAEFGLPVVPDAVEDFAGPLAGILAGLRWTISKAPDAEFVASVPADAPFVPGDLVARLAAVVKDRPGGTMAVASSAGKLHPVVGLWPVALAGDLDAALASGRRRAAEFVAQHGAIAVAFPPVEVQGRTIDPFFNINTPEALAEARALLGE